MTLRLFTTVLVLVVITIGLIGCEPASASFPTGEFIANTETVLNFLPDGKCILSYPPQDAVILDQSNCEYSVDGDLFFISTGKTNKCDPADGTYSWRLDGEQLVFELIEDPCQGRVDSFSEPLIPYFPAK